MFNRLTQLGIKRTFNSFQSFKSTTRTSRWFSIYNKNFSTNKTQFRIKFNNFYKRYNSSSSQSSAKEVPKKGIKALIAEYGYSALGVYLAISAVDLPLCFLLVHSVGVDKVREYQQEIKAKVKGVFGYETKPETEDAVELKEEKKEGEKEEKSGFWNNPLVIEGVLAYAIHKSLVFIRVPITAAVTPSVVKILRGWGFNIGKNKVRTIARQIKANPAILTGKKIDLGKSPSKKQKWFSWFF